MSSCCITDISDTQPCPRCGTTGPVIGTAPVRAHQPDAPDGNWQHCPYVNCPIVYYLDNDTITGTAVIAQVGDKATTKPTPLCFCFAHTPDDLADDLQANAGVSTIKAAIKTAVADGSCACEHLNPTGNCCLPDVHRTLKTITTAALASA